MGPTNRASTNRASTNTVTLTAEPLTDETFLPFGSLPAEEGTEWDRADARFEWNDGHVNVIGHTTDEVEVGDVGLRCELLNRHDTHTQTLMPLDVAAIVVVAPADLDFSDPGHLDAVRAFRLEPLDAVHLWVGTWHWGPYPASGPSVRLFNVQGSGYARDNGIAWLTRDHGIVFEVDARNPLQ
jgi:ureidoglycolate hydrolase